MTTLENTYCVPSTEDEWAAIDALNPRIELRMKGAFVYTLKEHGKRRLWVCHREKGNAKEIPVSRFIDLLNDKITPWRLEEVGFEVVRDVLYDHYWQWINNVGDKVDFMADSIWCNERHFNMTTFTELLTLIRFLTPPSK